MKNIIQNPNLKQEQNLQQVKNHKSQPQIKNPKSYITNQKPLS